jgi:hypothetical protein
MGVTLKSEGLYKNSRTNLNFCFLRFSILKALRLSFLTRSILFSHKKNLEKEAAKL